MRPDFCAAAEALLAGGVAGGDVPAAGLLVEGLLAGDFLVVDLLFGDLATSSPFARLWPVMCDLKKDARPPMFSVEGVKVQLTQLLRSG